MAIPINLQLDHPYEKIQNVLQKVRSLAAAWFVWSVIAYAIAEPISLEL